MRRKGHHLNIKIEEWNGHKIRFVEKEPSDWWAVLTDIAKALSLQSKHMKSRLTRDLISSDTFPSPGGPQKMVVVNEFGIYESIFESRKPEAKEFKLWVFNIIKTLRVEASFEGFQIFRTLDKEHQKDAMRRLHGGLCIAKRDDFIKANVITNKAVSTMCGHSKSLRKSDMTPDMLVKRQPILDDTVNLMAANDSFNLGLPVNKMVYDKYAPSRT